MAYEKSSFPTHFPTDRMDYVCPITDYRRNYLFQNAGIWIRYC